jgi:BlaI family penicillinase repressor
MSKELSDLSKTELEIMLVLWNEGNQTARQIVERLYGQHTQSLHTTVASLLKRLAAKGFVQSDRSLPMHVFYATISKEQFVHGQLSKLASTVFEGELAPLVMSLVSSSRLSAKDRLKLQSLIDKF